VVWLAINGLGDFKQLPPVGDRWIFKPNLADPYGMFYGPSLCMHSFRFFELTLIMHQREYLATASTLNNIAKGKGLADVKLIMSRGVTQSNLSPKTTR